MSTARRRRAQRRGRRAEALAAWWLRLKGYRVADRRFRVPQGEIDLIVRRGRVLAMVEVKTRGTLETALAALSTRQRHRIERAAAVFLQRRPEFAACDLRFDLVLMAPLRPPRHLEDAWRPADGAGP